MKFYKLIFLILLAFFILNELYSKNIEGNQKFSNILDTNTKVRFY
jgi:hypothetical protein